VSDGVAEDISYHLIRYVPVHVFRVKTLSRQA
jgi:hypothetical protein